MMITRTTIKANTMEGPLLGRDLFLASRVLAREPVPFCFFSSSADADLSEKKNVSSSFSSEGSHFSSSTGGGEGTAFFGAGSAGSSCCLAKDSKSCGASTLGSDGGAT